MKRTYKRADGSEETVEGSPEELVEYERRSGNQPVAPVNEAPKKPEVLRGTEVDGEPLTESEIDLVRWMRKLPKLPTVPVMPEPIRWPWDTLPTDPWLHSPWDGGPIWIASCSVCRRVNCDGNHSFTQLWITLRGGTITGNCTNIDSAQMDLQGFRLPPS